MGLAGCGTDEPESTAGGASPSPAPSTASAEVPPAPAAEATTAAPDAAPPAGDGCPPDVNLMYERLKESPVRDILPPSLTGLEEPTCADGWAVAHTVVKNADSALVLFKYEPATGRWLPVTAGTDGVCDGAKVPAAIQAKLGPGC